MDSLVGFSLCYGLYVLFWYGGNTKSKWPNSILKENVIVPCNDEWLREEDGELNTKDKLEV